MSSICTKIRIFFRRKALKFFISKVRHLVFLIFAIAMRMYKNFFHFLHLLWYLFFFVPPITPLYRVNGTHPLAFGSVNRFCVMVGLYNWNVFLIVLHACEYLDSNGAYTMLPTLAFKSALLSPRCVFITMARCFRCSMLKCFSAFTLNGIIFADSISISNSQFFLKLTDRSFKIVSSSKVFLVFFF